MTNSEVEYAGAAAASALRFRDIVSAVFVDEHVHYGMVDADVVQIPASMQDGDDADTRSDVVDLQERGIGIGLRAVNCDPVHVQTESSWVQGEVLQLDLRAEGVSHLL